MKRARAYHNLTLLPDGTVLASGGGSTSDGVEIENSVLPAEIWNPDTETWTEVDSLQNGRLYHSTALLLPDGRAPDGRRRSAPECPLDHQSEERGDLLAAVPLQGHAPDDLERAVSRRIRLELRRDHAGRGFDHTGVTDPASLGHARKRHEPALPVPQLHHRGGEADRQRAGERESRSARRLHALRAQLEWRSVSRLDGPGSTAADVTPPDRAERPDRDCRAGSGRAQLGAATDAGGIARYNVHRGTTAGFTPSAANRIAQPTGTSFTNTGLAAGTYYYRVTAEDVAGNVGPVSNETSAVVTGGPSPGLVAAYGFDEGSGTTTADQTGGHTGTLSNATWSTAGKYGKALSFNGTNAMVTVADSNALDLTSGMTIEGWVQPAAANDWRTLIVKERPGDLVYGLYSSTDANRPQSQVTVGGTARLLDGTAQVPGGSWTHVAASTMERRSGCS